MNNSLKAPEKTTQEGESTKTFALTSVAGS